MSHKKYSVSSVASNLDVGPTVRLFALEQPSAPLHETREPPQVEPGVGTIAEDPIDQSSPKGDRQFHLEGYVPKARHAICCLNCGSPVSLTTSVCERCRSDPFTDRMYDGLIATIHNISRGGIQIKTNAPLHAGQDLKIGFSLDGGIVKLRGTIVYCQSLSHGKVLAGVKFSELSEKDSELLNRFLTSCSSEMAQKWGDR